MAAGVRRLSDAGELDRGEALDTMTRPRLLDLFCGAGGSAVGYARAGFDVVGVDLRPQPHYPFEVHQADALTFPLDGFDTIHASPPCQAYSLAVQMRQGYASKFPRLIEPIRERLVAWGGPWVIENVVGAPLRNAVLVCGETFGLRVRRHRLFESNCLLFGSYCQHHGDIVGVYGDHPEDAMVNGKRGLRRAKSVDEAREAMGMPWAETWVEVKEAIPPAFTEHIGFFLMAAVQVPGAAGRRPPQASRPTPVRAQGSLPVVAAAPVHTTRGTP
jgi:DNA (cytosine-5)-methyltransferase 1